MIEPALKGDSTKVVAAGLPYKPAGGVILVTSDSVCTLAIAAFNAGLIDSTQAVTRAYVFKLGTKGTAYAVNPSYADERWLYSFFSSTFTSLGSMVTE